MSGMWEGRNIRICQARAEAAIFVPVSFRTREKDERGPGQPSVCSRNDQVCGRSRALVY